MADDVALRRWAIEQSIALHGPSGMTVDKIIAEAKTILAWVQPETTINVVMTTGEMRVQREEHFTGDASNDQS
jgi:hypothetical protein